MRQAAGTTSPPLARCTALGLRCLRSARTIPEATIPTATASPPGARPLLPFLAGLIAAFALAGCEDGTVDPVDCDPAPLDVVCVGPHALTVEIAATEEERSRGLSFRDSLPEDDGMLFVFEEAGDHRFWTVDTTIPLSIAFLDAEGIVLNVERMEPLSMETHGPVAPALYAVEANRGWFGEHGVGAGDTVRLGASAGPF